ncbi:MAG TPA: hypothetical protein PKM25_10075, partial [Candidatus Ozemobacteraceae bacterium]|nr:hypothetical protein [Candidatus Ozemobacteraceae bacterium]
MAFITDYFPGAGRFLRGFFILLVFGVFPLLTVGYGLRQIVRVEDERATVRLAARQERLLTRVCKLDDEQLLRTRVVERVFRQLQKLIPDTSAASSPPPAARALLKRLHRFFPDQIEIYFFSLDGLLPAISSGPRLKGALERGYVALAHGHATGRMTGGERGLLAALFRVAAPEKLPETKGRYQMLMPRLKDSGMVWDFNLEKPSPLVGMIAIFHDANSDPDRSLRLLLKRVNRTRTDIALGWCRQNKSGELFVTPSRLADNPEIMREALAALSGFERVTMTDTAVATVVARTGSGYLMAVSARPRFVSERCRLFLVIVGFSWMLLIFFRCDRIGTGYGTRLPLKLGGLFLLAAGIPSLLLIVSGSYALRDHAHVLRQNLEESVLSRVRNFDERLIERVTLLEGTLGRFIAKAQAAATDEARAATFKPLEATGMIDQLIIINAKGERLVEYFLDANIGVNVHKKLIFAMGQEVIRKFQGSSEVDGKTFTVDAASNLADAIVGTDVLSPDQLISGMRHFQTIRFGAGNGMFYENTLLNSEGKPEWLVH